MDQDYYDNPALHLPADTSGVSVIQAAQPAVIVYTTRDAAVFSANGRADAAGHLFFSAHELAGNDTVVIVRQVEAGGRVVAVWNVPPPPGFKIDHSSLMPSGPDLWVWMDAHQPITGQRDNIVAYAVIPGVFTPWPSGRVEQDGGAVESAPPPPAPEPSGPSNEEITADDVAALVQAMGAANAGQVFNRFVDAARRGAMAAGQGNGVPAYLATPDSLLTVLKDGLYQWQLDRIYQVLYENGLIHHTTATAVTGETNTNAQEGA